MDTTTAAALITAVASIVAATVSAFIGFRSAKAVKLKSVESLARLESAGLMANDYAYSLARLRASLEFDDAGIAVLTRRYSGLRSRFTITNFTLPFSFRAAGGDQEPPTVSSLTASHDARFEVSRRDETSTNGVIVFPGTLAPHDALDFEVTSKIVNAFALTREAARSSYKRDEWRAEYFAISLPAPTDLLELEVRFPQSHRDLKPPPSVVVFTGASEIVNADEISRIRTALVLDRAVARLTVKNPKLGLKYAISWMPPEQ
jgi:hypothetical protein